MRRPGLTHAEGETAMEKLEFTKMHGCGNDYVYVDCFRQTVKEPEALARRLSDRHKGVGGDGLILICPSDAADAKMRMFNADGSEGKMCGNGVRCVAEYLFRHGYVQGSTVNIETLAGIKHIVRKAPGRLTVDMGAPLFEPKKIPLAGFEAPAVGVQLLADEARLRMTCVSMGNPHCVIFVADPGAVDLPRLGGKLERSAWFPEGVNTEFVHREDATHLTMRVWERGSGITMACGTGACASVAAAVQNGLCARNTDVEVRLLGGVLTIRWTEDTILMTGEAVEVFTGTVEI